MDVQKHLLNQVIRLTIIPKDSLSYTSNKPRVTTKYYSEGLTISCLDGRQKSFVWDVGYLPAVWRHFFYRVASEG